MLLAYDLLEADGVDVRDRPLSRAARAPGATVSAVNSPRLLLSPVVEARTWRRPGRLAPGEPRTARRGAHAQAARLALPRRPGARRLVEVEDPPADHRRRARLRPARQRQAREPVHRLHVRRLGRPGPGAVRQGVLGPDRRGDPPGRCVHPQEHRREVRPGPLGEARARLRAGLRGHPALAPPPLRHRRALPAHPPLARGQEARRRRHARAHPGAAAPRRGSAPSGRRPPAERPRPGGACSHESRRHRPLRPAAARRATASRREKYALLRRRVEATGLFGPEDFLEPDAVGEDDLLRAHDAGLRRTHDRGPA